MTYTRFWSRTDDEFLSILDNSSPRATEGDIREVLTEAANRLRALSDLRAEFALLQDKYDELDTAPKSETLCAECSEAVA